MLYSDNLNDLYPMEDEKKKRKPGMKEIFVIPNIKKGKKKTNKKK